MHFFYNEPIYDILFWLLLAGFGFSIFSLVLLRWVRDSKLRALAWAEAFWELAYTSYLVYFTGGMNSVFIVLYALQILAIAAVLSSPGALGAAFGAVIGFGAVVFIQSGVGTLTHPAMVGKLLLLSSTFCLVGGSIAHFFRSRELLAKSLAKASTDLKDLGQLYSAIVDHIPSGILYLDGHGKVRFMNGAASRILGQSWVGKFLKDSALDVLQSSLGRFESAVSLPTGSRILGHHMTELPDGASVVVFQDVTDFRDLEKQIVLKDRLASVGQLAAGIAHEIRNPLASLSGSVQLLRSELKLDPEFEKLMRIVLRETDRLDHLASSFLSYARPSQLQLEKISIEKMVDEIFTLARNSLELKNKAIEMKADIAHDLYLICDPKLLRQILWNLVINGIQAIARQGELTVSVSPTILEGESALKFLVSDTGEGIDDEVKKRIFDPFFTTKTSGSGLGLALVYQMVKSHQGQVGVESRRGEGAKFWFELYKEGPKQKISEEGSSASAA